MANEYLTENLNGVKRMPVDRALSAKALAFEVLN